MRKGGGIRSDRREPWQESQGGRGCDLACVGLPCLTV